MSASRYGSRAKTGPCPSIFGWRLMAITAFALVSVAAGQDAPKQKYNMWAKEKVRYLLVKVQRDPHNAKLRVLLGNAYFNDEENWEAEKHLQEALKLKPKYAEAHTNLAIIYYAQSRFQAAQDQYEEALAIDSTLIEARAGLGTLLCRSQHHAAGMRHLETVLLADSLHLNARFNLGVAYHKVGDFRMATEHLAKVMQRWARYPGARKALAQASFGRGLMLLQAKNPQVALGFLDKAAELDGEDADFHFATGLAHMRLEAFGEAELAFARAVELESDHVPALHNLATVYELTGRSVEAAACYRRVFELTPHLNTIQAAKNAKYDEEYLFH